MSLAGDYQGIAAAANGRGPFQGAGKQAAGSRKFDELLGEGLTACWPDARAGAAGENDGADCHLSKTPFSVAQRYVSLRPSDRPIDGIQPIALIRDVSKRFSIVPSGLSVLKASSPS